MNRIVELILAEEPIFGNEATFDAVFGPVSQYPIFDFSMRDVKRAGEVISGSLPWADETEPQIRRAFQIANNWRDAHTFPMRSVRCSLIYYIGYLRLSGITAARLKRMQAIRKKLRRPTFPMNLSQMQDLGGCRAILSSMDEVQALTGILREHPRHELSREDDYVRVPKADGYRSHHLIIRFRGASEEQSIYNGRRIEIQIRTRLQHSWATAVEAIGLFRGENLKGSQGDKDWLRLFRLMSAEFAEAENCPIDLELPAHSERVAEIKALNETLDAFATLDHLRQVVRWTELSVQPSEKPSHFLIRYDNVARTVDVQPYYQPMSAITSYDNAEEIYNKSGEYAENIVLVEVDKLETLKEAYPNYFGDVQLFTSQLKRIVQGKRVEEYKAIPQQRVSRSPEQRIDLKWVRRSPFRKPRGAS